MDDAWSGSGGVIGLIGAPGIGKTAILRHVVDTIDAIDTRATVIACTGVETEQQLAFAGLSDLLAEHVVHADALPAPQREALRSAIALGPGGAGGSLAVATAAHGVLRSLATIGPVLVAIDDAQWLDAPTAETVAYVARRLTGLPIALVATCRAESVPPWLSDHRSLTLEPLDAASSGRLIDSVAADLSATARDAVLRLAAGVPLALVELPAELDPVERSDPGRQTTVMRPAGRIGDLYVHRVSSLQPAARDALLIAALTAHEDLDTIEAAWQAAGGSAADAAPAETARLIRVTGGSLRFVHPLVRSALVHTATEADRRRAHAALAAALGADERGWHLAAARPGPSNEIARALDDVAQAALARRAPLVACDAFAEAARRSDQAGDRLVRRLAASDAAQRGGDLRRAVAVLDDGVPDDADLDDGERFRLDLTLGAACSQAGLHDRAREVLARVAAHPAAPRPQAALAAALGSYTEFVSGRAAAMFERAEVAERLLDDDAPTATQGQALVAIARSAAVLEQPARREAALGRLELLLPELAVVASRLVPQVALLLVQFGRVDEMLDRIPRLVREAEVSGEFNAVPFLLVANATAAIERGDWDLAEHLLDRSKTVSIETGLKNALGGALFVRAQVAALRGDVDLATGLLDGIDAATGAVSADTSIRALTALAAGDLRAAADHFRTYWDATANNRLTNWAPSRIVYGSDAVEVLQQVGDRPGAEAVAAEIRRRATLGRDPLALAEAARADGLLGGTTDLDPSACYRDGLAHLEARPFPFAHARLLLCLGEAERRAGRPAIARPLIADARDEFERLGARSWLGRAGTELRAAGGRRRTASDPVDGLTDRERDVARAIAAGRTNPEIAAALFVSVKTIETHASKVFAKLGLRNRTELAAAVQRNPGLLGDH